MFSFQGFVTGKICIAETKASACDVLNSVGVVTTGAGPRIRPSWLIRSDCAAAVTTAPKIRLKTTALNRRPKISNRRF